MDSDIAMCESEARQRVSLEKSALWWVINPNVRGLVGYPNQSKGGDGLPAWTSTDRAISQGRISTTKITRRCPALSPLEGNPQFEAIQARMIEHLNSERQKLGLEPVSS